MRNELKLAAKRHNERLKLAANWLSTLAAATLGAALILPLITGKYDDIDAFWILSSINLHCVAQWSLRWLRLDS